MTHFILKKMLFLFLSLFVVISVTFALMHLTPGDPFVEDRAIPKEILKAMHHHYGLDKPWYIQYGRYLKGLVTFDLGPSFKYQGRNVSEIILQSFPISLILGLEALSLSIFFGIVFGSIAALKHLKWQDHFTMLFAVIGISFPSFICATFLQYVFAMKINLFPVARWGSFSHSVLPALSLASLPTAFIARLTRSNMVEIMQEDYIQTAQSKGLSPFQVALRHALRNAFLPILTYLAPLTATVFTGSFAIEKVFGLPGLGHWFVMSITNRDYTMIMGTTVFYSALLLACVFLIDVLYCLIDPRIKLNNVKVK